MRRLNRALVCHLHFISSEIGSAFHGASSVEHMRFTQHNFNAFNDRRFFCLRCLYFQIKFKKFFVDLFRTAIRSVRRTANKREFRQRKCFDYINFAINRNVRKLLTVQLLYNPQIIKQGTFSKSIWKYYEWYSGSEISAMEDADLSIYNECHKLVWKISWTRKLMFANQIQN